MRGPLVFLVSLLGVAAVAVLVVLPAYEEKSRLLEERGNSPDRTPSGDPLKRYRATSAALRRALGAGPEGWDVAPADHGAALAGALGVTVEERLDDGVTLGADWNQLPGLLVALSKAGGPTLEKLTAVPGEEEARCRVKVRFRALPDAPEGR